MWRTPAQQFPAKVCLQAAWSYSPGKSHKKKTTAGVRQTQHDGWMVTDGGWRIANGSWRVTDGGWMETDRSLMVTTAIKHQQSPRKFAALQHAAACCGMAQHASSRWWGCRSHVQNCMGTKNHALLLPKDPTTTCKH